VILRSIKLARAKTKNSSKYTRFIVAFCQKSRCWAVETNTCNRIQDRC